MLDFLGFIATLALMVLAVNAVITFMGVSPSAKLTLATLAGLWIGIAAAAGSAGMIAISKPFPRRRIICGSAAGYGSHRDSMASSACQPCSAYRCH